MRVIHERNKAVRLASALAAGVAVAALGMSATAPAVAKESKPKAGKGGFSSAFQAAAVPLQQAITAASAAKSKADAGDAAAKAQLASFVAGAPQMLAAAEAAASTPQDRFAAGQLAMNVGILTNDPRTGQRGAKAMIDSGQLAPASVGQVQTMLGKFAYQNKDYTTASSAFAAAAATGTAGDDVVELLGDSYAKANNPQGGLAELRKAVAARRAAGRPVPESWLKRANTIAYNSKLQQESMEWATLHAELYPTKFNWLGSAQLVRRSAQYGPQETIDLFRLMARSGALQNEPRFVATEYKEYVEAADPRRSPGEVLRIIDQGVAAGAITNSGWVAEARATANSRVNADKAALPGLEREARAAATGLTALSTADAYLDSGQAAKAEELYRLALQKGGVDKDRALTRLGIAQVDQGKYAAAQESFRQVAGPRLPLARLWLTFIGQKDPSAVPRRAG